MVGTPISVAWFRRLIVVALVMLLAACQSTETRRFGSILGSVAGSIGGSYLGSYLGGTAGSIVGAIAGGVGGYYLGSTIGGYLGKDDQRRMAETSQQAYETNQTQTFTNPDSGVRGKAEIVGSAEGGECKTIRQTVVLKDGKTVTEDVKSCKE